MSKRHFNTQRSDDDFGSFLEHALAILYKRRAELNRVIYYLERLRPDECLKDERKYDTR